MPRQYGPWIQDPTFETTGAVSQSPISVNTSIKTEFVDPGTPLAPPITADNLDGVTGAANGAPLTENEAAGQHFTVGGDEDGGLLPGDTTYFAQKGASAFIVHCNDRSWAYPGVPAPGWDGVDIDSDTPFDANIVEVIWHSIAAREFNEGIGDGDWFFKLWYSNLPDWEAIPGAGGPGSFDVYDRLLGATFAREFQRGELVDADYEVTPLPGLGPVYLGTHVSGPAGYFVVYGMTQLESPMVWDEPFGSTFHAEFGGNFTAPGDASTIVTYRLKPPRYRYYRDVEVLHDTSPKRLYPRRDDRGLTAGRRYPTDRVR